MPAWENNGSLISVFDFKPMVRTTYRDMGDLDRARLDY